MCDNKTRMKFKRGSKVEVFSTKAVSSGSWYTAEIIHGNGHYYTVKYDGEGNFDRVARKSIRPCPPLVQVVEDWDFGQVLEVFHCFSWKMATFSRVLERDRLLVRLIGSSDELEVRRVDIRPRLCWQDDEWNVIGKESGNCGERHNVALKLSNLNSHYMEKPASICFKNASLPFSTANGIHKTPAIPSQSLKRKFINTQSAAYSLPSQKVRVLRKEKKKNHLISIHQSRLPEKVDAIASSRAMMANKCMPSLNYKLNGFSRSFVGREKRDGAVGCSRAINLELKGADSIDSSVASCSLSRKNICTGYFQHNECSSDAESFCRMESDGNSLLPAEEKVTDEIHRIELHAYRSTIEALYASGPLSWEKETLLTNLRDSLHITNDEHLTEVRSLLSSSTGLRWSLTHVASKCPEMILGIFNLFGSCNIGQHGNHTFLDSLLTDVFELLPLAVDFCIQLRPLGAFISGCNRMSCKRDTLKQA